MSTAAAPALPIREHLGYGVGHVTTPGGYRGKLFRALREQSCHGARTVDGHLLHPAHQIATGEEYVRKAPWRSFQARGVLRVRGSAPYCLRCVRCVYGAPVCTYGD